MNLNLEGRVAIVTGGSSNIGRGIVLALAREGANVAITYRDEVQANKTATDATTLGVKALPVRTDISDAKSVGDMVSTVLGNFGRIDILVNNVGVSRDGPHIVDKSLEEIEYEIRMNLWATVLCSKLVAAEMVKQEYGRIINMGSSAAAQGRVGDTTYCACKQAIVGFTRSLARELGPRNITVNCVSPGWIMPEKPEDVGKGSFWHEKFKESYTPGYIDKTIKSFPIKRVGVPRDIAEMVTFLASDCGSYITGQTFNVNGGATMT